MLKKIFLIIILLFTLSTQSTFSAEPTFQELINDLEDVQQQSDENKDDELKGIYENKIVLAEFELDQARDEFLIEAAEYDYEQEQQIANAAKSETNKKKVELDATQEEIDRIQGELDVLSAAGKNDDTLTEELYYAYDELYEVQSEVEELKQIADDAQESADIRKGEYHDTQIKEGGDDLKAIRDGYKGLAEMAQQDVYDAQKALDVDPENQNLKDAVEKAKERAHTAQSEFETAKATYDASPLSKDDISSIGFKINVNDITPGKEVVPGDTVVMSVNRTLGTVIQSLMMLLGSLSLLIMTVGAGYMILHHGQDELLSKGKTIFISGVYALVVALGSYYLVAIFRFILFSGNS